MTTKSRNDGWSWGCRLQAGIPVGGRRRLVRAAGYVRLARWRFLLWVRIRQARLGAVRRQAGQAVNLLAGSVRFSLDPGRFSAQGQRVVRLLLALLKLRPAARRCG